MADRLRIPHSLGVRRVEVLGDNHKEALANTPKTVQGLPFKPDFTAPGK